ncbi:MAG: sensor histidine kinase [Chitinophagaceae bacterium]
MPTTITARKKTIISCFIAMLFYPCIHAQKLNEDSIRNVIRDAKEDTARIDAMLTYANYLIKHKMQDSTGLVMLEEGKKLAEKKSYPVGVAQALLTIGNYYSKKSNWERSLESYRAILRMSDQIKDETSRKKTLRSAYNNLGNIFNINGDFTSSLENKLNAVKIIESMQPPNPNDITIASLNIASDYRQLKEYKKAREYMNKVTPLLPAIKDFLKLEYYYEYYQILVSSDENNKAQQVLRSFDSSLQVFDLSDFQKLDYTLLSRKIHGLYEMEYSKNYANAVIYFMEALPLAKEIGKSLEMSTAQYNYGWALFELGKYTEAVISLEESYSIANENDLKNHAFKAADLLAQAYEKLNSTVSALRFTRTALSLKDSIVREEANEQLNFLEAKYQYEKKEKEITTLQKDNLQKEFVIRKKNWFITGAFILAALLGLISFIVYRYYRNRQQLLKKEKSLQEERIITIEKQLQVASLQSMINGQETERIRIAKDLHDGLGGLFSTVKMHYSTLQQDTPSVKENPLYKKTLDLINNAADELRKVAHNMMPEVLMKVGLAEALQDFCNNISSGKLLTVTFQTFGMEKRLSSSTEIMLYRIIQELVNNIIKHAYATEAVIQINRDGNRLSLIIEDNGRGFDTREADEKRTMGIATVKSRVDYLNGKLTIDSRKNIGTTVMIDILLNEN